MTQYRAHPIMIMEHLWRFGYLLIIPLARGIIAGWQSGLTGWLEGAWLDLLVLLSIFLLALLRWYFITCERRPDGLYLNMGLIWHSRSYIPQNHIDTLAITYPFYLKPFGAVRLRADTKAGNFEKADVKLTLRKRDAEILFEDRTHRYAGESYLAREYKPRGIYIAALSAILSNSLAGVLFFSTFITQTGNLLGEEFENRIFGTFETFTRMMAFGIPPAAAAIAYLMLFGWLYTFIRNLIRHKNFCARRGEGALTITGGIFTNRRYSVAVDAINYVDVRQSVLTKILGLYSVFIHAVGFGKAKDDVSALIPASNSRDLMRHLSLLLPEFKPTKRQVRPNFGALFRFLNDAFWWCVLLPLATYIMVKLFPSWSEFILWVGFMCCLPAYLFLTVRIIDFTTSGIGRHGGSYTLRYSSGFYLHTVMMPRDKVATITLRQSIFQKMDNKCDVLIFSISEKRSRHHIRNIDKTMALQVLDIQLKENGD
ncbi:PH domain-containing protein [Hydrogenoanaerobacterium sp.]|uniref:PH domain-containing protein n=1 Tax=Hydrogenoanaerobacterium sp. TaxID=2953763 RepID=UPI00289B5A1B|nr:PH domain-containing protein [Hydrogenoanaerobacterium sp.]